MIDQKLNPKDFTVPQGDSAQDRFERGLVKVLLALSILVLGFLACLVVSGCSEPKLPACRDHIPNDMIWMTGCHVDATLVVEDHVALCRCKGTQKK